MLLPHFVGLWRWLHWNRPELIRDYDTGRLDCLPCAQMVWDWNRPELIRDYDIPNVCWGFLGAMRLKQTWIDKGLRQNSAFSISDEFYFVLKQTWIDKGLRPQTQLTLSRPRRHWNRPELIRDYDFNQFHFIFTFISYWNRPELIRDYDDYFVGATQQSADPLKQTWIDKGLRPPSILLMESHPEFTGLKQTWIDKGLRQIICGINVVNTILLKQTWIDKGLRLA